MVWITENLELAAEVYIDRFNGAPCCRTKIQLFKGGKDVSLAERREDLLVFLRGKPEQKDELKAKRPLLYEHFKREWAVHESHMNRDVPAQHAFILTLCYKPDCFHPLCLDAKKEFLWFENGPVLTYILLPIPDPGRPWGGSCEECSNMCSGHYLKPEAHFAFVKDQGCGNIELMYKPLSLLIKEKFYQFLKEGKEMT